MPDEKLPLVEPAGVTSNATASVVPNDPFIALGMDTQRIWATNFVFSVSEHHAVLVAREIANFVSPNSGELSQVDRNVASLVMPLEVAVALRDMLNRQFPSENA